MNKQELRKIFAKKGIEIISFEFNEEGHRLALRINPEKSNGWEDLETMGLDGFIIVSPRYIDSLNTRITLVPCNAREFTYYIQKYVNKYGLSRSTAMTELERIALNIGDPEVYSEYIKYKNKF